jgi:hypothetical protein
VLLVRLLGCAALTICVPGCFLFGGGRPKASLVSNDPGRKIPAIKKARDANQSETAQQLVKSLNSEDPAVRFYAIRGLQNLTGETFGYVWYVDEPVRRAAAEKWAKWVDANHAGDAGSIAGSDPGGAAGAK